MSENTAPARHARILYFDLLKAVAIFCMIMLHVTAEGIKGFELGSDLWCNSVWVNACTRWCVPVFVMISGALALNPQKETSLKKLWGKSILRLVIAFFFWSFMYCLYRQIIGSFDNPKSFVMFFFKGEHHLWFISMIIVLYALTPALKLIAANRKVLTYTVAVAFALMVISGYNNTIMIWGEVFSPLTNNISLNLGYIGYYLLGYLLATTKIKPSTTAILVGAGVVGLVITGFGTVFLTDRYDHLTMMTNNLSLNVLLMAVGVFVAGKALGTALEGKLPAWCEKLITFLGNLSLGAYMVHVLVQQILSFSLDFSVFPLVLLATLVIYAISYAIAGIMRSIPVVGKYLA